MRERMKAHALDGFSLIAGLVFVGIGLLVLVDAGADRDVDPRWILAALLVGLGLAGVLGSFEWSRRGRRLERALATDTEDADHEPPTPHRPADQEER